MATQYPYDALAVLHDGTAITADGAGSVAYYDVGAAARFPAVAVINVTAIDAANSDETYDVVIQGCEATNFSTTQQLGSMTISRSTVSGRYTILFDNDQDGVVYRYIRVYFDVAGTTPSISADVYLAPLDPVC